MENLVINIGNPRRVELTVLSANGVKVELSRCTDVQLILWINGRSKRALSTQISNDVLIADLSASELSYLGEYSGQVKYTDSGVQQTTERVYLFRVANEFFKSTSGTGVSDTGSLVVSVSTPIIAYDQKLVADAEKATADANAAKDLANTAATNANDKANLANTAARNADIAKANAEKATADANTATLNASNAATNANDKAAYAKEQGDYAKQQGLNAVSTAGEAATNADNAAFAASQQAAYAKQQGDYAKQEAQGIDAKIATKANQSDLVQLEQKMYENRTISLDQTTSVNGLINSDGSISNVSGYYIAAISVVEGETYTLTGDIVRCAVYDIQGNLIKVVENSEEKKIPAKGRLLKVCFISYSLIANVSKADYRIAIGSDITNAIDYANSNVKNNIPRSIVPCQCVIDTSIKLVNHLIKEDSTFGNVPGYNCTDYLPVRSGCKYKIAGRWVNVAGMYDSYKKFLHFVEMTDGKDTVNASSEYVAECDGYIVIQGESATFTLIDNTNIINGIPVEIRYVDTSQCTITDGKAYSVSGDEYRAIVDSATNSILSPVKLLGGCLYRLDMFFTDNQLNRPIYEGGIGHWLKRGDMFVDDYKLGELEGRYRYIDLTNITGEYELYISLPTSCKNQLSTLILIMSDANKSNATYSAINKTIVNSDKQLSIVNNRGLRRIDVNFKINGKINNEDQVGKHLLSWNGVRHVKMWKDTAIQATMPYTNPLSVLCQAIRGRSHFGNENYTSLDLSWYAGDLRGEFCFSFWLKTNLQPIERSAYLETIKDVKLVNSNAKISFINGATVIKEWSYDDTTTTLALYKDMLVWTKGEGSQYGIVLNHFNANSWTYCKDLVEFDVKLISQRTQLHTEGHDSALLYDSFPLHIWFDRSDKIYTATFWVGDQQPNVKVNGESISCYKLPARLNNAIELNNDSAFTIVDYTTYEMCDGDYSFVCDNFSTIEQPSILGIMGHVTYDCLEDDAMVTVAMNHSYEIIKKYFDRLKETGYTVVSLYDIRDYILGRRKLPAKTAFVLFDDYQLEIQFIDKRIYSAYRGVPINIALPVKYYHDKKSQYADILNNFKNLGNAAVSHTLYHSSPLPEKCSVLLDKELTDNLSMCDDLNMIGDIICYSNHGQSYDVFAMMEAKGYTGGINSGGIASSMPFNNRFLLQRLCTDKSASNIDMIK